MCHFIYMILPQKADSVAVEALCRQHELAFRPVQHDKIVSPYLLEGEQCYMTTTGMCDCGTPLVSQRDDYFSLQNDDKQLAKRLEKFRKEGWSQSKINKWLSQKIGVREKRQQHQHEDSQKYIARWYSLLNEILLKKLSSYVGICVLWEDKTTVVNNRIEIKISPNFAPLQQNTVCIFTEQARIISSNCGEN